MLLSAFNNTEKALGKSRAKEPRDFFYIVKIGIFAVLIIPLILKFLNFPAEKAVRNIICDINYLIFSAAALAAVLYLKKKNCFAQRIRITVLLAALAMPMLIFMTVIDIFSASGFIRSAGEMLENGFVSILFGLAPICATVLFYILLKKRLMPKTEEEND